MKSRGMRVLSTSMVVALVCIGVALGASGGDGVVKTSALPNIELEAFQEGLLRTEYQPIPVPPSEAAPDRRVQLGGVGSDLFRAPGSSTNEFWMITDRGPNGEVGPARTFPAPWFNPTILHVRAPGPTIRILDAIPIVGGARCNDPVGGLPNVAVNSPADSAPYDEPAYAYDGTRKLDPSYRQSGLDTEGLVRTSSGDLWVVEEYSPSLVHLDPVGCVKRRYVPSGLESYLGSAGYPVTGSLPAIYQWRKRNRGFEALGIWRGKLFLGLQSPLINPTTRAGNESLNTRILRFDLETGRVDAEWVYRFQDPGEYEPGARGRDVKVSALVALDEDTLLVEERTDILAKIYLVELDGATNILGTWDCRGTPSRPALGGAAVDVCSSATTGSKSLEELDAVGLTSNGIVPARKTRLVATLYSREGFPEKIEGLAVLNPAQIAIANDNDFNIVSGSAGFDAVTGNMKLRTPLVPSQVIRIKIDEQLPVG